MYPGHLLEMFHGFSNVFLDSLSCKSKHDSMFISVYYWQHLNTTQVLERQRERERDIFIKHWSTHRVDIFAQSGGLH